MKKVLIIGSRGFIGTYVTSEFHNIGTYEVYEGYKEKINILEFRSFQNSFETIKPDIVINLAAFSHLDHASLKTIFDFNTNSVIKILDYLVDIGFQGKFINTSSALVYGSKTPKIIKEDLDLNPEYSYAIAKAAIDYLIPYLEDKINFISCRPFNCIGVGHREDYVVPKIVQHFAAKKKEIELGNYKSRRDFVDVRDVGKMFFKIADSDENYSAYNLCSGKTTSILEIIKILEDISGNKLKIVVKDDLLRNLDHTDFYGNNNRIKELGFEYQYTIKDTLNWMLSYKI